jgi:PTH1 family peptidyl-tRNA hydrolase
MWLLVGLGNPGAKYEQHRHNIGFNLIDAIAAREGFPAFTAKHNALISKGRIGDVECVLCKPQSFMNKSGPPIAAVARFFQIPVENVLVFHDELDLPLGKIRLKQGGGAGGHNGLKSIDAHFGKDYHRLRFGIDHPGHKDAVSGYVLHDFDADEQPKVAELTDDIARYVPMFWEDSPEALMTRLAL